jgi:hypothetical protein
MKKYPKKFTRFLKSIKAKRPKTVIEHILKHGHITTQELKDRYGYNHPPRAVRDVREQGVPIITFRVVGSDGRKIAAYKFGDPQKITFKKFGGRTAFSKDLKDNLIKRYGSKCFIYLEEMDEHSLQIDHRIPYEVAGDTKDSNLHNFMLLSVSANRAKSWSCEHCKNWLRLKDVKICSTCYWAFPENYMHIAMLSVRRVDLIWQGKDVEKYEKLKIKSRLLNKKIPQFVKEIIEKEINNP